MDHPAHHTASEKLTIRLEGTLLVWGQIQPFFSDMSSQFSSYG
tara:strand:+ start:332 stop:460 length:129 start_codon:yes stop_codon:yes gene_type:complete